MPAPTPSRHNRTLSPPTLVTPSRNARSLSGYSNYTPTVTSGNNSGRMNIVTRVALEGRAKQGDDGASIKMYLKLAVPVDSVVANTSIPLFPEENVKVLSSQVHPLDNNSVPYNFSSTLSPLLHRAAAALNLPARSQETFNAVFDISPTHSNVSTPSSIRASKHDNPESIPPVDPQYAGQILVSGYNISYVLPKHFLVHASNSDEAYARTPLRSRRASVSERNTAQFMVAIDMWVPYVSQPARYPYLLSIPTPRCLHNHIKLRIFPPNNTSNSYASLSSVEDDASAWDLTSDPHVTRASSTRSLARSNSYNNLADDESSDSSTAGFSEGCGIQGTFVSAERIRIRWARPSKAVNVPGGGRDGRRRVGVKTVKGEMTCVVRGKQPSPEAGTPEGVVMDVNYKGTCSGVWFPGVATLLGMDIGLEARGCDVAWPEGGPSKWEISGGTGFTGFDIGPSTNVPTQSRGASLESNQSDELTSSNGSANGFLAANPTSRTNSSSSTSSLLRAPLPAATIGEYSFEGSTSSLPPNGLSSSPLGTMSSIGSISASMQLSQPANPSPPGLPITLHLNMNELLPPAKNVFTFTISGTVVLVPRHTITRMGSSMSRSSSPLEGVSSDQTGLVMLPKFTVLAADSESTTTILRNELEAPYGSVDVYHATGDIRDAQAKKTVLQRAGYTKCGNDGARIVVKDHDPHKRGGATMPQRPTTPIALPRKETSLVPRTAAPVFFSSKPTIPVVSVTVMPFPSKTSAIPAAYSVSMRLNVPAVKDAEWLEFGFAQNEGTVSPSKGEESPKAPKLQLVSATVKGVPVETVTSVSTEVDVSTYGVGFERIGGKEWVSWIKLRVGLVHGSDVVVEYLVKEDPKARAKKGAVPVLLPTFLFPVGKLDVTVRNVEDFTLLNISSNFAHRQSVAGGCSLQHFFVEEFFYPQLSLAFKKNSSIGRNIPFYFALTWILLAAVGLPGLWALSKHPGTPIAAPAPEYRPIPEPLPQLTKTIIVTSTSTVYQTVTIRAPPTTNSQTMDRKPPRPSSAMITSTSRSVVTPSSSSSSTPTNKPTPAPPHNHHSTPNISLQPFRDAFQFSWPEDFSAFKDAFEKLSGVTGFVWLCVRRLYHYPLDPN